MQDSGGFRRSRVCSTHSFLISSQVLAIVRLVAMLRLSRVATKLRNANSRNFSTPGGNIGKKPDTMAVPLKTNASTSNAPVVAAAVASLVTVVLIINANNPWFSEKINAHAPFLNTVLAPFRPAAPKKDAVASIQLATPPAHVVPLKSTEVKAVEAVEAPKHAVVETPSDSAAENIAPVEPPAVEEEATKNPVGDGEAEAPKSTDEEWTVVEGDVEKDAAAPVAEEAAQQQGHFSAAEEVHDLERTYEEQIHATHSIESEAAKQLQAAAQNVEGSTLLHYELQNQARVILTELQNEMHRQHEREMDERHKRELEHALKVQAAEAEERRQRDLAEQAAAIVAELQDQMNHQVASLRKSQVDELLAIQPKVDRLQKELATFQAVASETAGAVRETLDTHHISASVLQLELALSHNTGNAPVGNVFDELKHACASDPLVQSVLSALPQEVLHYGALGNRELLFRFNIMRDEVRKVALAPEDAPKMLGQLIGTALSYLTWQPKGYVTGQGVEDTLARAEYLLDKGRIREALQELDGVSNGYAQTMMADFKQLALNRLILDQSIAILKAKSVLRHKSFNSSAANTSTSN